MNNLCIFGDSVAKGIVFDDVRQRYAVLKDNFISLLQRSTDIPICNFASFGATVTKGKKLLDRRYAQLHSFDYTLLEFGGNDCNLNWQQISEAPRARHDAVVPLDRFRQTYEELIEEIIAAGSCPLLMTLPPLDAEKFFRWVARDRSADNILEFLDHDIERIFTWHRDYNDMIFSLAKRNGLRVLDIRRPFLARNDYSAFLCTDGMHPNARGHRLIAEHLAAEVAALG